MSRVLLGRHVCTIELTDPVWELLRPLLPTDPPRGGRWKDHRTVISGILFRERTGIPWRDLPDRFGNWKTIYTRKRRWAMDGTWQRIADRLRLYADLPEGEDWTVSLDSTVVRAHQHAAGARHAPAAEILVVNSRRAGQRAEVRL